MTAVNEKTLDLRGLSGETKPIHWPLNDDGTDNANNPVIGNGSTFFEINTGKAFMFDAINETWQAL